MKQGTFSKPVYADWIVKQKMKATSKRKSLADKINEDLDKLYARRRAKKPVLRKVKRVSKQTYYKELLAQNKWINKIPLGSHGSTPLQKKLWKVTSDYVRICDFYLYKTCPSCLKPFTSWQESQCGHYRAYSLCKGYKKFDDKNTFAQCAYCNSRMNEDKFEGGRIFSNTIIKRYGQERLDLINTYTQGSPEKLEVPVLLDMLKDLIKRMGDLPEKPDYYWQIAKVW